MGARVVSQLVAKMPAAVGLLADVAGALSGAGVNIEAVSAYERDAEGKFLLVTSDNAKAASALEATGAEVREKTVVLVEMPNRPGALEEAARRIANAGINIEYAYGTVAGGAGSAMLVFKTADDERAAGLF